MTWGNWFLCTALFLTACGSSGKTGDTAGTSVVGALDGRLFQFPCSPTPNVEDCNAAGYIVDGVLTPCVAGRIDAVVDHSIIAVLENDYVWGDARDISDVPPVFIERLQHYFLTYKLVPGEPKRARIKRVYPRTHALKVIRASMADYADHFPS
jgi:hypothetical protein